MPRYTLLLLAFLIPAYAEQMSRPTIGVIVNDETGRLRKATGVAGAARLEEHPMTFSLAAVSPGSNYLLAASAGREVALYRILADGLDRVALPDLPLGASSIDWSPTGASAILYYGETARAVVVTGLPARPVLTGVFEISRLACRPRFALSDDGALALALCGEGVFQLSADASPRRVAGIARAIGAAFLESSRTAALADAGTGRVFLLSENGALTQVADGLAGLTAVAGAGKRVLAAVEGGVELFQLNGEREATLSCLCTPTLLRSVGPSTFQITAASGPSTWFLDLAGAIPRLFFASSGDVRAAESREHRVRSIPRSVRRLDMTVPGEISVLDQTPVSISLAVPADRDLHGRLRIAFEADGGAVNDTSARLSSGGHTAAFVIRAGASQAVFADQAVLLQAGDRGGRIRVIADLDDPHEAGTAIREVGVRAVAPSVSAIRITTLNGTPITLASREFEVQVDGVAPGADLATLLFRFRPTLPGRLTQTEFRIDVRTEYAVYFRMNGQTSFRAIVPFTVSGSLLDIASASVQLINVNNEASPELVGTPEQIPKN